MTDAPEKKGMSKGCLVGIIVVSVLLVLIIVGGFICYYNRADLVKFGLVTVVTEYKNQINANPDEQIDTTVVNAVTDAFIEKFNQDELNDKKLEQVGLFMQNLQGAMSDEEINFDESEEFLDDMIRFYPELEDLRPPPETEMDSTAVDSLQPTD